MKRSRNNTFTAFVTLDTGKCKACWLCMDACSRGVIGRVNLPWHKHALLTAGGKCTGCRKCVAVCKYGALTLKQ